MDPDEIRAELFVKNNPGKQFRYIGDDPIFKDQIGTFEILEDMICCAPTQNILFAFNCPDSRKVLLAKQVLDPNLFEAV